MDEETKNEIEVVKTTEKTEEKQNRPHLFQKGVSGNPNGRPAGARNFTTKVKEALAKIADGTAETHEELLIRAILEKAITDKDTSMMRTVWEQLDGKPLTRVANADGSKIFPQPIIGGQSNVHNDDGDTEAIEAPQEN